MPIFFSSAPTENPGVAALDDEAGKFFAVHFGEDDEHIREAAVGDPHFLAVQNPVLAVRRKHGARARSQRVRTGLRLGEAVAGNPFAGGDLRQIFFLLLFGAEINDGNRADARVAAVGSPQTTRTPPASPKAPSRKPCPAPRRRTPPERRRPAGRFRRPSSAVAASGLVCAARDRESAGTTSLATNSSAVWPISR